MPTGRQLVGVMPRTETGRNSEVTIGTVEVAYYITYNYKKHICYSVQLEFGLDA